VLEHAHRFACPACLLRHRHGQWMRLASLDRDIYVCPRCGYKLTGEAIWSRR
jgi:predicted RNA-binding Zn-ribbon protein involved in translation (DUF1610 family)